jgi:DNA-directed RNA polymerase subunit L
MMKLKLLERKPGEMRIEIEGETHTFCNLLQRMLLEDSNVEFAGYDIAHPLVSKSVLYLRMKGKKRPEDALKEAANKISGEALELKTRFQEALEQIKIEQK